jgi:hypothetical protein
MVSAALVYLPMRKLEAIARVVVLLSIAALAVRVAEVVRMALR